MRNTGRKIILAVSLVLGSAVIYAGDLVLEKSYFIDSKKNVEPSGLIIKNGNFYFISDDEDKKIYKLIFSGESCKAETSHKLEFKTKPSKALNYEGINAADDGYYYLLSEPEYRLVKVSEDGKALLGESFLNDGRNAGFFKGKAKGPEGMIVYKGGKKILIASQGDKGKLLEGDIINGKVVNFKTIKIISDDISEGKKNNNWISDLYLYRDRIYVLLKKQNKIVELKRNGDSYEETGVFSYDKAISAKKYSYLKGNDFGEGLAVDDKHFYVIFDNNKDGRLENLSDERPLFIILKR